MTVENLILAARAARTPAGLSSKTRQEAGCGRGGSNREAHTWNMSGAGFPALTSGSEDPQTTWWKKPKSSLWCLVFISNVSLGLEVATAIGIFLIARSLTLKDVN